MATDRKLQESIAYCDSFMAAVMSGSGIADMQPKHIHKQVQASHEQVAYLEMQATREASQTTTKG